MCHLAAVACAHAQPRGTLIMDPDILAGTKNTIAFIILLGYEIFFTEESQNCEQFP